MNLSECGTKPPYHRGEVELQRELGVHEQMVAAGRRAIRGYMPLENQQFLARLRYLIVSASDAQGRPWVSMVEGKSGFIEPRGSRTLRVQALPRPSDPLLLALREGSPMGLLGIDLSTRRRNRLSGHVIDVCSEEFTLAVTQTVGNCPKYIQVRDLLSQPETTLPPALEPVHFSSLCVPGVSKIIRGCDTFFIASQAPASETALTAGVDVSHRGGRPGFVLQTGKRSLVFPDFLGNSIFMTLGNLQLDPRAGLPFVDFADGTVVAMTGTAELLKDPSVLTDFARVRRAIRFELDRGYLLPLAISLRWGGGTPSPDLDEPRGSGV